MKKFVFVIICLFGMIFGLSAETTKTDKEKQFYEDVITLAEFKTDCLRILYEDPCEITKLFITSTEILESKDPCWTLKEHLTYVKRLGRKDIAEFEEVLAKIDLLKNKYDYNNLMPRLLNASANDRNLKF